MSAEKKITQLIEEEDALKSQLKETRSSLKLALEASEIYKAVLEKTLAETEPKVSKGLAKAHALKVARSVYAPEEEEEDS